VPAVCRWAVIQHWRPRPRSPAEGGQLQRPQAARGSVARTGSSRCESAAGVAVGGEVFGGRPGTPSALVRGERRWPALPTLPGSSPPGPHVDGTGLRRRCCLNITARRQYPVQTQQASLAASAAPVGGSPEGRPWQDRCGGADRGPSAEPPAGPLKSLGPTPSSTSAQSSRGWPARPELARCAGAARRHCHGGESLPPTPRRNKAAAAPHWASSQRG